MDKTGWQSFLKACIQCKNEDQLAKFLEVFLTIEERENIATRITISRSLLLHDETQRAMAKSLRVSISKITRGSNSLKALPAKTLQWLGSLIC